MIQLENDRILLRALEPSDADILYTWENAPELWQYGNTLTPYSKDTIAIYIDFSKDYDIYTTKQLRLMICDKSADNTPVGCIDLTDFNPRHRRAAIGIMISEKNRGNNFAVDALNILIDYAFEILNLKQLYCDIEEDNTTCVGLFEKKGFVRCGEKKEWLYIDNRWKSQFSYQLINKE
ncbi:MAG: GNAT family protein [Bacteroidales bacterium]|nr:GNAT family protein [Bacteroidales bacterium]